MCTTESWLRLLCNGEHGFFNNAEILLLWRVARVRVKAKKYFDRLCAAFLFSFDFIPVWCSRRFRHKSAFTVVPVLRLSICADEAVIGWNTGHRTPEVGDIEVWILCYCTDINSPSICTLPPSIYFLDNFQICTFSLHILTHISLLLLLTFFTTGSFL